MTAVAARPRQLRLLSALRRPHAPLVALLLAGLALRVLAFVAIYPGIFFPDTNDYVKEAVTGILSLRRVGGYALVVAPFWRLGSAAALIALQHAFGLAIVVLVYALLVRRGAARWVALLAVVPVALDAYFVDIEHEIMSETVFHLALVGALAVLLWNDARPGPRAMAAGGLLLGYAAVVRSVAFPLIVLFVVYLLVRRVGWRRVGVFVVAFALVTGGYATLFNLQHGKFGFTEFGGRFLYAQVAPFAACSKVPNLPADERALCPDPAQRLTRTNYLWGFRSPLHFVPIDVRDDARVGDFAKRVIRAQPLDYAHLVLGSLAHYFAPGHYMTRDDYPVVEWQFPKHPHHIGPPGYRGPLRPGTPVPHHVTPSHYLNRMVGRPHIDVAVSRLLHSYQRYTSPSGELLTPCLLLVVVALALRRGPFRLRADAALIAACAVGALLVASALSVFDYRYGLEALILLPAAAALAWTAVRSSR
jgi:hypothetical protein